MDGPPIRQRTTRDIAGIESEAGHVVNPSQLDAVKLALSNRVALIQGPPGNHNLLYCISNHRTTDFKSNNCLCSRKKIMLVSILPMFFLLIF